MAEAAFDAESFLKSLTTRAGVYQMYGEDGELLYVGKAKNLKNRVSSYFRASGLAAKTMAMVAKIRDIQVTVTETETPTVSLDDAVLALLVSSIIPAVRSSLRRQRKNEQLTL